MISLGCNSKVWYNEHSKDTAIPIHQKKKKKKDKCPPPKKNDSSKENSASI